MKRTHELSPSPHPSLTHAADAAAPDGCRPDSLPVLLSLPLLLLLLLPLLAPFSDAALTPAGAEAAMRLIESESLPLPFIDRCGGSGSPP